MCSCHVYALKLETEFRKGTCCPFSADEFEADFQGTLAYHQSFRRNRILIKHQNARPSCHIRRKGHVLHHL